MGFDKKPNILETFWDFTTTLNTTSGSIRIEGEILSQDFHINKQQAEDAQEGLDRRMWRAIAACECQYKVTTLLNLIYSRATQ